MVGEWPQQRLGDVVTNFDTRRVPLSARVRESRKGKYPYYGATGIMDYIDDYLFEGLHLLIAEDGSVETERGTPFLQLVNGLFWVNNHAHVLKGETDTDTRYLFYALSSIHIRPFMTGSVQPKLSQSNLNKITIPYPSSHERGAIAHILGTLDDKIELNRRMNQTLEAMAQALFKSWFVDFEPFRAGGMQDSPLGEIPAGWKCASFVEAIEINPPRKIDRGIHTTYVDMSALPTASARVLDTIKRPYSGSGSRFANGDVLLARITPCLENGKTALVDFLPEGEIGWGSTEFIVLGPKSPVGTAFIYCLARHEDFRIHAIQAMTGTSGRQRVDTSCFNYYWLAIPEADILHRFEQQVKPWFQKIKANDEESRILASIRDTLLPKLLSGEIRVKEAEKFVEKAL